MARLGGKILRCGLPSIIHCRTWQFRPELEFPAKIMTAVVPSRLGGTHLRVYTNLEFYWPRRWNKGWSKLAVHRLDSKQPKTSKYTRRKCRGPHENDEKFELCTFSAKTPQKMLANCKEQ